MGHIGSDPVFSTLPNGTTKTTISIATNIGIGEKQKTQWHTALFWGKAAEAAAKLKKGDGLYVTGVLEYRKWTDTNTGLPREKSEITVQHFSKVDNPLQTINQINILGHVGNEAQFKAFTDNAKTTISVATNSGFGDKQKVQWHTVIFWGKAAELTSKLKKGDEIFVSGYIDYRKWVDTNSGQNREKTEIFAQQFSIISGETGQITIQNVAQQQPKQSQGYANTQPQAHTNAEPHPKDFAPFDANYNPEDLLPVDVSIDLPY